MHSHICQVQHVAKRTYHQECQDANQIAVDNGHTRKYKNRRYTCLGSAAFNSRCLELAFNCMQVLIKLKYNELRSPFFNDSVTVWLLTAVQTSTNIPSLLTTLSRSVWHFSRASVRVLAEYVLHAWRYSTSRSFSRIFCASKNRSSETQVKLKAYLYTSYTVIPLILDGVKPYAGERCCLFRWS